MAMADRLFPRFLPRLLGTTVLAATLAGAGAPAWSLDLLQAYQAAQEQDPRIRAARAARDAAAERLPQARAQLLPNLSASMGRSPVLITTSACIPGCIRRVPRVFMPSGVTLTRAR